MHTTFRNLVLILATSGAIKTWTAGEVVQTSDLNGNFSHIHNKMVGGHGARLVDADVSASANISTSKLAAAHMIPVAWANLTYGSSCGGTCTLEASQGVTSVVRSSAGIYHITLAVPRANSSYAVLANGINGVPCLFYTADPVTTNVFSIACFDWAGAAQDSSFSFIVLDNN